MSYEQKERLGELTKLLIIMGFITEEDLMPLIKKGTSKWLKKPENKIFKN